MEIKPIVPPHFDAKPAAMDLPPIDSVALQRLIEEVRRSEVDGQADMTVYNRTYHRHNR